MPTKPPKPQVDPVPDSAGISDLDLSNEREDLYDADIVEDAPEPKVKARYVGIEPVMAHVDGEAVIIAPGDPIPVSKEQLEQNPDFQPWED